jgi:antitoxin ParD1/3/4
MRNQIIKLTKQNDEWLKIQVAEQEYSSKSEAISYLIKIEKDKNIAIMFRWK